MSDWNESHYRLYASVPSYKGIVVTAGGNMGMYTRPYSEMYEHVYVFEPDWKNFHALVHNNYAENVYFFRAGLGATCSWGSVETIIGDNSTNHGMHKVCHDNGPLPIMTVDQLNLPRLDLLQLDIEGGEKDAIAGAKETIEKFGPLVVTEGNHSGIRATLEPLGYSHNGTSKADYIWEKQQ